MRQFSDTSWGFGVKFDDSWDLVVAENLEVPDSTVIRVSLIG